MLYGATAVNSAVFAQLSGGDPLWASVGLYMRFNGSNGSTSFIDEKGSSITPSGSPVISTADGFGGACGDFPSGAYLSSGLISGIAGLTSSTSWSIELRAKITWAGDRNAGLLSYSPTASGDDLRFFLQRGGSTSYVYIAAEGAALGWFGSYTHVNGQFMSFQASCDGSTIRVFVDGTQIALNSFSYSSRASYQSGLLIGTIADTAGQLSTNALRGQIDELRVTKGAARNTTSYTPATSEFPNY